jgi:RNA polymerase sigma factor (sigma-70 family)
MKIDTSLATKTNSLSNYDLIEFLKHPDLTSFATKQLQTEFHGRFKNRLYQNCLRLCHRNRVDEDIAKDLFQDTMIKALENLKRFCLNEDYDLQHSTNTITKWLNKIAFNLFIDYLEKQYKSHLDIDLCDEEMFVDNTTLDEPDELDIYLDSINFDATLQSGWDTLNDKERLVVYYGIRYNCLHKKHMPDDVIIKASKILGVKRDSIRQIKLRALEKFRIVFNIK